jgi:hypothetical protein
LFDKVRVIYIYTLLISIIAVIKIVTKKYVFNQKVANGEIYEMRNFDISPDNENGEFGKIRFAQ